MPEKGAKLGFFDTFQEVGGNFVGAEEKAVLIENGIPLTVLAVVMDEQNKYGPRFVAKCLVPNPTTAQPEERSISFPVGSVDSRDRMLTAMSEWLRENPEESVTVKLEKAGRAILLRKA